MNICADKENRKDLYSYRIMKDKRMLVYKDRKLVKMIDSKTSEKLIGNLHGKDSSETHKILAKAACRI